MQFTIIRDYVVILIVVTYDGLFALVFNYRRLNAEDSDVAEPIVAGVVVTDGIWPALLKISIPRTPVFDVLIIM